MSEDNGVYGESGAVAGIGGLSDSGFGVLGNSRSGFGVMGQVREETLVGAGVLGCFYSWSDGNE